MFLFSLSRVRKVLAHYPLKISCRLRISVDDKCLSSHQSHWSKSLDSRSSDEWPMANSLIRAQDRRWCVCINEIAYIHIPISQKKEWTPHLPDEDRDTAKWCLAWEYRLINKVALQVQVFVIWPSSYPETTSIQGALWFCGLPIAGFSKKVQEAFFLSNFPDKEVLIIRYWFSVDNEDIKTHSAIPT